MNIRFFNGTILTLENGTELSSGEVWVFDHLIGYVGKPQDNNIKWDREINLNGNLIMPGFKDAHTHSAMTFLRSFADDLPLDRWLNEKVFPMEKALTGNIMLELCFAIILPALAAAILFFENASGGGTDIVAMIIKKYSTMNISGALFLVDCFIVVVSFMVFDITTGLCSVLGLMAKTLLIDKSIERMKLNKYFTIISSKPEEISDFIMKDLNRSATIYHGEGVYTNKDKKIILTVVDVKQAVLLQRFIDEVDPQAFLMVTKSSEVIGKGFMSYI